MFECKIYTQYFPNISKLTSIFFTGYMLVNGTGYWKDKCEASVIIIILAKANEVDKVSLLAEAIRAENRQLSVLVTTMPIVAEFCGE